MYEVEYKDGHTVSLAANLIAENLFAHVYQEGNRFRILDSITGTRTDGTQVLHQDAFIHTLTGIEKMIENKKMMGDFYSVKRRKHHLEHTEGCKIFVPTTYG